MKEHIKTKPLSKIRLTEICRVKEIEPPHPITISRINMTLLLGYFVAMLMTLTLFQQSPQQRA